MKTLIAAALALPLLAGCLATSGDLQRLADSQAELEAVLADRASTDEEIEEALEEYGDEIAAVAADVKERGEGFFDALADPSAWTPAGLLSAAVMLLRNQSRKKLFPPTQPPVA